MGAGKWATAEPNMKAASLHCSILSKLLRAKEMFSCGLKWFDQLIERGIKAMVLHLTANLSATSIYMTKCSTRGHWLSHIHDICSRMEREASAARCRSISSIKTSWAMFYRWKEWDTLQKSWNRHTSFASVSQAFILSLTLSKSLSHTQDRKSVV